MPGAEVVHTFVATMRPDANQTEAHSITTAPLPHRTIGPWSDAIPYCRLAGCRGADSAALMRSLPHPEP